ncbi:uncharacterized protein A4U43_C07F32200 [Asparagus officinalis]|uniref:noroxomaritidine synthase n=1 Tax=Asparagus officinalis TaxID=4686 RepID=A0A5P1EGL7_ASPOF|nr:alkane hydroxylase MAH1-like [Asparagus officinalis]ONK64984.1 uncharacterized protein A4U43_C07F32200 [Asparagus officinalis]
MNESWHAYLREGCLVFQRFPEIHLAILAALLAYLLRCTTRRGSKVVVNWPVVGMLPTIIANNHHLLDHVTSMFQEFGNTFMFKGPWFCGMDSLLTCSPDNANHMFNVHFSDYPKGEEFIEIFDVFGDGILNVNGDLWKDRRRMVQAHVNAPRFRSSVGELTLKKVVKVLLPLLNKMAECDKVVNLSDVSMRLIFDTICDLAMGVDPGYLASDFPSIPFAMALDQIEQVLLFRHIVPRFWWKLLRKLRLGKEKKMAEAMEVIDRFVDKCIRDKREREKIGDSQSRTKEERTDVITSFINHSDDKFLRDTSLTFLAAGNGTTGAALIWLFWLVTSNPDVEKKMLEELRKLRPSSKVNDDENDEMTVFKAAEIEALVYLQAVVCETLRLYPSLPFNHKVAKRDDILPSGHKVQAGTKIIFSMYSMGRREEIWGKDCLEFKPERWITEKGTLRLEPSYKFIAFHSGARSCLGKNMAITQIKLIAAAVIYNFNVQVVEGHAVDPKIAIIIQVNNGLQVKLKRRSRNTD